MRWSVDRIEADLVLLEDENGNKMTFDRSAFPVEVKEGDLVLFAPDGTPCIDKEATQQRKQHLQSRLTSLFQKHR